MNFTQKGSLALIGKVFGAILSLLIGVVLARVLGADGIGQYQLIISSQVIIITILAMGFGNASIYFINSLHVDRKSIISNLFKLFSIVGLLLFIIFSSLLYVNDEYFGIIPLKNILIFVFGSVSLLLLNVIMPVFYANLEIVKLQIVSLSSNIVRLIGFILLSFFIIDVGKVIVISGLGNFVSFSILCFFLRKEIVFKEKINYKLWKDLFLYGIKISATNLVFILSSNLTIFLIKFFLEDGFVEVGLFTRATAISNMFLLIPVSLGPLFYSKWSGYDHEKLHLNVEKILRILFSITFICFFLILFFGKYLLIILFGEEFIGASISLKILSLSIIFSSFTIILTNVFSSIGKPQITLIVFLISLLITGVFSFFLIPKFGIEGGAIAVLLGILFNAIALFYKCHTEINLSIKKSILITLEDIFYLKNNLLKFNKK